MSERQVRSLFAEAEQFTTALTVDGWSEKRHADLTDAASAADLFANEGVDRPLVVGLFGGTGVGKSSLLNRLAGSEIARTGVVRPTSMEITAYLHSDKQISSLPAGFPSDRFSQVHHNNEQFVDVMWVDMPDFDSEETQNRDQVTGWLPHIDLLLYVVTPERYKDEEGWRLLIKHGYRHAWLFVMNQWDRAQDIQLDDFKTLLSTAGFQSPRLYRTVCASGVSHPQDEFEELADFVAGLAQHNIVKQLEQRGWLARLGSARARLHEHIETLQHAESETPLLQSFDRRWAEFSVSSRGNLDFEFKEYSQQFAQDKTASLTSALKSLAGHGNKSSSTEIAQKVASSVAMKTDVSTLWDNWSATRLQDSLSEFELAQSEHGVPLSRLRALSLSSVNTSPLVRSQLQLQLEQAIQNPGSTVQRQTLLVVNCLQWVLPLAALLWVAYRVVGGFIGGASDTTSYVGMDFLVNGMMLVAIAWLIPWLLVKVLKPSIPKSVYKALRAGLDNGLQQSADQYRVRLEQLSAERRSQLDRAKKLQKSIDSVLQKKAILEGPGLEGMVLSTQT